MSKEVETEEKKDEKSKYWTFLGYPESMVPDWKDEVGGILQLPYAYCEHNRCKDSKGEIRKTHVHFILAFPNTTTYNHVLKIAKRLGAINTVQACINIRWSYDYLIHDTEDCRKKKKYLYPEEERICGNNFDIGSYEQLSKAEKDEIVRELMALACSGTFYNFSDFSYYVIHNFENKYISEFVSHQSLFNNIIKGNYHKVEQEEKRKQMEKVATPCEARRIGER